MSVRLLFLTQSESLRMFDNLRAALDRQVGVERAGFTIADSLAYERWLGQRPDFENEGHLLLKEWDVTSLCNGTPDYTKLADYERKLGGEAGLFGAIVADRRLFMGPDCTYSQDYRRRYTDAELLVILTRGLEKIERMFDELQPDAVVGFICVTMLDYLAYLVAVARDVRVLNLRPTRVGDRVSFADTLNDPSRDLATAYARIRGTGESVYMDQARAYVKRVREEHGRYEGVVKPSDKPALRPNVRRFARVGEIASVVRNYSAYRHSIAAIDNHVPDPLRAMFYATVINPLRARRVRRVLGSRYAGPSALAQQRYAFFPLHTEPEVSLLVYGRPYVNQIEIIRMLAMSLPADMTLVVKEHPWMVGKRSLSSYKKILNIPRVQFVDPQLDARTLILGATLVCVVTGSVALEAAILGKPVVTFGDCPYNLLPESLVRRCDDPRHLPVIIGRLLDGYAVDDRALHAYVAGVFETSASVNLYSVLLGKKNVYVERAGAYHEEIEKLAAHGLEKMREPRSGISTQGGAAIW